MKAANNVWQKIGDKFHDTTYEPDMLDELALAVGKSAAPSTEKKPAIADFLSDTSPAHLPEMSKCEPAVLRKHFDVLATHLQQALNWCVPSPGP